MLTLITATWTTDTYVHIYMKESLYCSCYMSADHIITPEVIKTCFALDLIDTTFYIELRNKILIYFLISLRGNYNSI